MLLLHIDQDAVISIIIIIKLIYKAQIIIQKCSDALCLQINSVTSVLKTL